MKLWLLKPADGLTGEDNLWESWYDKVFGFVIRAETEQQARQFANNESGDEDMILDGGRYVKRGVWLDSKYTSCIELIPDGEAGMILRDFRAA